MTLEPPQVQSSCLALLAARTALPRDGAVHATFVASLGPDGRIAHGEAAFGWNARDGSWYYVNQRRYMGYYAPQRVGYSGKAGDFASLKSDATPSSASVAMVERTFYAPLFRDLAQDPSKVIACEQWPDGSITVTVRQPAVPPGPEFVFSIRVDGNGRVTEHSVQTADARREVIPFTYPDDQEAGYWVPSQSLSSMVLASYEFDANADPARFEPIAVAGRSGVALQNTQRSLSRELVETGPRTTPLPGGPATRQIPPNTNSNPSAPTGLVATGIVVVLIALVVGIRRRLVARG